MKIIWCIAINVGLWLNSVLEQTIPEDEDWRCDEVFDFETREAPFTWRAEKKWDEILDEMKAIISRYLEEGQYAGVLKNYQGVGIGFVDGDGEILFVK